MAKRRIPDPRVDPHDADETTPCESCQIDLRILQRAYELEAEQGHATNIVESLQQEDDLELMWSRRPKGIRFSVTVQSTEVSVRCDPVGVHDCQSASATSGRRSPS